MRSRFLETAPVPRAVMKMAVPMILSMLVVVVYNTVDTFFVGQTGDPNQVAAVSLATPIFIILMALGNIFGVGGMTYISRLLGQGNREKPRQVSALSFYGAILVGVSASTLILLAMPRLLDALGASPNTAPPSRGYLTWIAIGAPVILLAHALSNLVRSNGAAREGMVGMMVGTITNIILDPIMILWLDMGVSGAAIATVIGNAASIVYFVRFFLHHTDTFSISLRDARVGEGNLGQILGIGMPASLNQILMAASNVLLNRYLGYYGDAPIAAMGIALKVNTFVILLQIGFAVGIQPLVGYTYGAGNHERLRAIARFSRTVTVGFGTLLTITLFALSGPAVRAFIDDPAVVGHGITMLRALMAPGPVIGIAFVQISMLQAMGKMLPSLVLSLSRQGLAFVPLVVILNQVYGLAGLTWAQPLADMATLFMSTVFFTVIMRREQPLVTRAHPVRQP